MRKSVSLKENTIELLPGDRVEPTATMVDVAMVRTKKVPFSVTFWRKHFRDKAVADRVKHRNPIIDRRLGTSLAVFMIDILHGLYLGVYQFAVCRVLWEVIKSNPWNLQGHQADVLRGSLSRLEDHLGKYYVEKQVPFSDRLGELSEHMIGTANKPELKSKGAETGYLVGWALSLCKEYADRMHNGGELLRAMEAIYEYLQLLATSPVRVEVSVCQRLMELAVTHNTSMQRYGFELLPKHHLLIHITHRTVYIVIRIFEAIATLR